MEEATDNELVWFHEGYGMMKLYRLLQVDDKNFIAEDLHKYCRTSNPKWETFSEKPELALNSWVRHELFFFFALNTCLFMKGEWFKDVIIW